MQHPPAHMVDTPSPAKTVHHNAQPSECIPSGGLTQVRHYKTSHPLPPCPHLRHRAVQQRDHDARVAVREHHRPRPDEARAQLSDRLPRARARLRKVVAALRTRTCGAAWAVSGDEGGRSLRLVCTGP